MIVYLDMDGVLADFEFHAKQMFGNEVWQNNRQFWKELRLYQSLGYRFWEELPVMKGAKELISAIEKLDGVDDICVLSATGNPEYQAEQQKINWLNQHFPDLTNRYFVRKSVEKAHFADENSFLIDDREKSVIPFVEAGGHAHLYDGDIKQAIRNLKEVLVNERTV